MIVVGLSFVVTTDLLLKYEKSAIAVLPQVAQCLEIVQDPKGLAAIIWIVGQYGQVLYNARTVKTCMQEPTIFFNLAK